jgi:hypothetical protein
MGSWTDGRAILGKEGPMYFYLGTHMDGWLATATVPLFVSHRRLMRRVTLPRAVVPWCLDSGGFSELSLYGEWRTTQKDYIIATRRYQNEIGMLDWAAIQDYMCEPHMLKNTGLSIRQHQELTTQSFLELSSLAPDVRWLPILQGWDMDDYERHLEQYRKYTDTTYFGLGSVCRRQATEQIGTIVQPYILKGYNYMVSESRY